MGLPLPTCSVSKGRWEKVLQQKVPLFSTTITKKNLMSGSRTLYLRKQFSVLCNRCSHALLYDIFNASQFCLAPLQLPLQRYVVIIYMHYDCLIMFV